MRWRWNDTHRALAHAPFDCVAITCEHAFDAGCLLFECNACTRHLFVYYFFYHPHESKCSHLWPSSFAGFMWSAVLFTVLARPWSSFFSISEGHSSWSLWQHRYCGWKWLLMYEQRFELALLPQRPLSAAEEVHAAVEPQSLRGRGRHC